jgi:cytochrome c oxidase assembly factor CtaG
MSPVVWSLAGSTAFVGSTAGPTLPPLTWTRVVSAWRPEPVALAAESGLALGYLTGVRRVRAAGARWPAARVWSFLGGVAAIAVAVHSFVGVYDDTLFWVRAVQNVTLLMVAPMLLALGAPLTLLRDRLPAPARRVSSRLLHSGPARAVTFPLVITVVLVLPLPVVYFSGLYERSLRDPLVSGMVGAAVLLVGFVYFWSRLRVDPVPRRDAYGVTLAISIVEVIGDAVLGVVVWLGPLIAAGFYAALTRDWGPALRTDQDLGAGVLWVGGDVVGLPFIAVIVHRMALEDDERAAAIDRRLDAEERWPGAAAVPDPETDPPAPARLWWEDHPELRDRF